MQFLEKIKTKSSSFWRIFKPIITHKDLYRLYLPSIAFVIVLLIAIPFTFDNSALKFKIEEKAKEVFKTDFEINGDVRVSLFPSPAVTMDNVYLQNFHSGNWNYNFYAKRVTVKSSYLSLIMRNTSISEIVFGKMILEKSDLRATSTALKNDAFTEILQHKVPVDKNAPKMGMSAKLFGIKDFNPASLNAQNFPRVIMMDSNVISFDRNLMMREIKNINCALNFSKNKISGKGNFSNQDLVNDFELMAHFHSSAGKNKSLLKLTSSYANFVITGDFLADNKGIFESDFKGKIEGEIFDFKNFYKSYVSSNGLIFNKLNPTTKPIKITAAIDDFSGSIIVNNINIASPIANGAGNAVIDLTTAIPLIDLRLDFQSLDLDALWLHDKTVVQNQEEKTDDTAHTSNETADLQTIKNENEEDSISINLSKDFRNFDITAELSIAQTTYLEEVIKNINLYITVSKEGELLILPLTLETPGGGLLRMNGALTGGSNPKFIGKIDISGNKLGELLRWLKINSQNLKYDNLKDYVLYSDIMITPTYGMLNGLYLNINNDESELLGEVRLEYAHKTSNIISNFRINHLDLNNYFLTSGQNAYLSYGKLLNKLLWLNDFSSNNDMTFAFDKLTYNNSTFNNQSVKLHFGQGYFEVRDLKLKSDDGNMDMVASIAVDISGSAPKFDMNVKAKEFSYQSTPPKVEPADSIADKTEEATTEKPEEKSKIISQKITAIDQFFALPSLEGFSGKIDIDLADSYFDGLNMKNLLISGTLKDGIVELSKLSGEAYGGKLEYKGAIGMKLDKTFSGNLTMEKIILKDLLSDNLDLRGIDGVVNISSSILSSAAKSQDFIKNLDSEIKFSAANVSIAKLGLNDLVKKMFNVKNYLEDLRNPEKILFNENAKTNFSKASGTIAIKKGRDDKFNIEFAGVAINGLLNGQLNLIENSINASSNIIFLTGDRKKQIPITIASNIQGKFDNLTQSTNIDQARQYLGLKPLGTPVATSAPATTGQENQENSAASSMPALDPSNPTAMMQSLYSGKSATTMQELNAKNMALQEELKQRMAADPQLKEAVTKATQNDPTIQIPSSGFTQ